MLLKSKNLCLRNLNNKDLEELFEYRNDINCYRYQSWENTSLEYLKKLIENNRDKTFLDEETMQLAVALLDNDDIVGDMFVAFKDKTITLGYTISTKYQRRGYAYEILSKTIDYIFDKFDGYEIACLVHPYNEASMSLLNKLNFKSEGYVEKIDSIVYVLTCK